MPFVQRWAAGRTTGKQHEEPARADIAGTRRRHPRIPVSAHTHSEAIGWPAIKCGEDGLIGGLRQTQTSVRFEKRETDFRSIHRRQMLKTISRGHSRIVPIHHDDPGTEPEQEEQAERHSHPTMDEDQRLFQIDRSDADRDTRHDSRSATGYGIEWWRKY